MARTRGSVGKEKRRRKIALQEETSER